MTYPLRTYWATVPLPARIRDALGEQSHRAQGRVYVAATSRAAAIRACCLLPGLRSTTASVFRSYGGTLAADHPIAGVCLGMPNVVHVAPLDGGRGAPLIRWDSVPAG